jgi:hypothetical protein
MLWWMGWCLWWAAWAPLPELMGNAPRGNRPESSARDPGTPIHPAHALSFGDDGMSNVATKKLDVGAL